MPALTDKDRKDAALGLELEVDYMALSFVREAADVEELQALIKVGDHPTKVVAKIEDQHAVKRIRRIIRAADAIMVARGDLVWNAHMRNCPLFSDTSYANVLLLVNR